jgi:hypothetical protein
VSVCVRIFLPIYAWIHIYTHTSAGTERKENCSCISDFYKSDDLQQCYVCPALSESVPGLYTSLRVLYVYTAKHIYTYMYIHA